MALIILSLCFLLLDFVSTTCTYNQTRVLYQFEQVRVNLKHLLQPQQKLAFWFKCEPLVRQEILADKGTSHLRFSNSNQKLFGIKGNSETSDHLSYHLIHQNGQFFHSYTYFRSILSVESNQIEADYQEFSNSWVLFVLSLQFDQKSLSFDLYKETITQPLLKFSFADYRHQKQDLIVTFFQQPTSAQTWSVYTGFASSIIQIGDLQFENHEENIMRYCQIVDHYNFNLKWEFNPNDFFHLEELRILRTTSIPNNQYTIQGWVKVRDTTEASDIFYLSLVYSKRESQLNLYMIYYMYHLSTDSDTSGFRISLISYEIGNQFQEEYSLNTFNKMVFTEWHYFRLSFLGSQFLSFEIALAETNYYNVWQNPIMASDDTLMYIYLGEQLNQGSTLPFQGEVSSFYFILNPIPAHDTFLKGVCHHSCNTCTGPNPNQCLSCSANSVLDITSSRCECYSKQFGYGASFCLPITYLYPGVQVMKMIAESNIVGVDFIYGASFLQCSFGYFSFKNSYCIQCPGEISAFQITCSDCFEASKTWSSTLTCSFDYFSYQNSDENVFIRKQRLPEQIKNYFIIFLGNQPLLKEKPAAHGASCSVGYFLKEGYCMPCIQNCLECGVRNDCTKCVPGYYRSVQNDCVQCGKDCLVCESKQCFKCIDQTKYFISFDGINCLECRIAGCKYCFQYQTSESRKITTLDAKLESVDLLYARTGCALCMDGLVVNTVDFSCGAPEEPVSLPLNCKQEGLLNCAKCLVSFANNGNAFCHQCSNGFYLDIVSGDCLTGLVDKCLTYGVQNPESQDLWKWEIIEFYTGQLLLDYKTQLFNQENIEQQQVVCTSCMDNYRAVNNTCIQWNCDHYNCMECQQIASQVQCVKCMMQGDTMYSRFLNQQSLTNCIKCCENHVSCIIRTSENDINPIFAGERTESAFTYFNMISPRHIDWDGFLMSCPDNEKCLQSIQININLYCSASEYYAAKNTLYEQNIFGFDLLDTLKTFESDDFVQYLRRMFIRKVILRIKVFNHDESCNYLANLKIDNVFSKLVYSITYVSIELTGADQTVKLRGYEQYNRMEFREFHEVSINNFQFEFANYFEELYQIAIINTHLPSTVKMRDIYFKRVNDDLSQARILLNISLSSSISIKNLRFHKIYTNQSQVFLINTNRKESINLKLDGFHLDLCSFYDLTLFSIPLVTINQNKHQVALENVFVRNSAFNHSTFILTEFPSEISTLILELKKIFFNQVIVCENSTFIQTPLLYDGTFAQIEIQQLSLNRSNLICSNILKLNGFILQNSYLFGQGTILSNTNYYPTREAFVKSNTVKLTDLAFKDSSFQSRKQFISLSQYSMSSFNVTIVGLEYTNIIFDLAALSEFKKQSFENSNIYILATDLTLERVKIQRSNVLPELTLIISNKLDIINFEAFADPVLRYGQLGYQKICFSGARVYSHMLYISKSKLINLTNTIFRNMIAINNPLIIIVSFSIIEQTQNEKITFQNVTFDNNLLILDVYQSETSLISVISEQSAVLIIENSTFSSNQFHNSITDSQKQSATTLKVSLINGKVSLINCLFRSNLATNTTHSTLNIKSSELFIEKCDFIQNNVLSQVNLNYFQNIQLTKHNFKVQSNGGSGYFEISSLSIVGTRIMGSYGSNGGSFYILTQDVGIIAISGCNIYLTTASLNYLENSKGGFLYIDSKQSYLNLKMVDCYIQKSYARIQGGVLYINPSIQKNTIDLANLTVFDCYSLQHGLLSFDGTSTNSLISSIIIQDLEVRNSEAEYSNFIEQAGYLSINDIEILQTDNPMIYISNSNTSIFYSNFDQIQYQQVLKVEQSKNTFIKFMKVSNNTVLLQPVIKIVLNEGEASDLKIESLEIFNVIQFSNWTSQDDYCQLKVNPIQYLELECLQQNLAGVANFYEQANCQNFIFRKYKDFNMSLVEVSNISQYGQISLFDSRLDNISCPNCKFGLIFLQMLVNDLTLKITIENLLIQECFCGVYGCLSAAIQQIIGQDFPVVSNQSSLQEFSGRRLQSMEYSKVDKYSSAYPFKILVKKSSFINNKAHYGAGIFVARIDLLVDQCLFLRNYALLIGGGIYFKSEQQKLTLFDSELNFNSAPLASAIYATGVELSDLSQLGVSIINANASSTPLQESTHGLAVSFDNGKTLIEKQIKYQSANLIIEVVIIKPFRILGQKKQSKYILLPSGQQISSYQYFDPINSTYIPYNLSLKIFPVNRWNQRQSLFSEEACSLNGEKVDLVTNQSTPENKDMPYFSFYSFIYDINKQIFNLDSLKVNFNPYNDSAALNLIIKCPFLKIPIYDANPPFAKISSANYELHMMVQTFKCQMGEFYDQHAQTCQLCNSSLNQYSVTFDAQSCQYKNDVSTIEVKSAMMNLHLGFWRPYVHSQQVEECYHLVSNCLGGWSPGDTSCFIGHIGALCEQCDLYNIRGDGCFSQSQKYACASCEKIANNSLSIALVSIWTFVSIIMSVRSTTQTIEAFILGVTIKFFGGALVLSKSQSGILIKLFTTYLQIVGMISTFALSLPPGLNSALDSVGNPVETMAYSLDCFLKDMSDIQIIYFRNVWGLLLPIFYFATFTLLYTTAILTKLTRFNVTIMTTSYIYLYLYFQPNLIGGLMSLVSFRLISNEKWVQGNVAYRFDNQTHYAWVFGFVLPNLLMLSVLIPLCLFLWLYRRKERLWQTRHRRILGYLYNEFAKDAYYWEIIKIIEKQFMIIGLTYYEDYIPVKAAIIFLILFFYMRATSTVKPYLTKELNEIDQRSTVICSTSIVCASTIYSAQLNNLQEIIWPFYLILGAINGIFCLNIIFKIIIAQFSNINQQFDSLRLKVRSNYPLLQQQSPILQRLLETDYEKKARLRRLFTMLRIYLKQQVRQKYTPVEKKLEKSASIGESGSSFILKNNSGASDAIDPTRKASTNKIFISPAKQNSFKD